MISDIFPEGSKFCGFLFASLEDKALPNGVNSLRKNLLLEEQILSFKELTPLKMESKMKITQLVAPPKPLNVYTYTITGFHAM